MIQEYLCGRSTVVNFCDLFSQFYALEVDYDELTEIEYKMFTDLSGICSRFSDDEEDLKLYKVYFDEEAVKEKVLEVAKALNVKAY